MSSPATGPMATFPGINGSSPAPAPAPAPSTEDQTVPQWLGLAWYWWLVIGVGSLIFLILVALGIRWAMKRRAAAPALVI